MTDFRKTLVFVAVAAVLGGSALLASIERDRSSEEFRDQGQPFFPDFRDPAQCTSLEVVDVDPVTAAPRTFKVMLKDGRWVIPSHYDYPADAKDRLAQTAARVIDLRKDTIRSDRVEDQKTFGVLDPTDLKLTSPEGVGKRITLKDRSDRVLAEYIIGKDVPGHNGQKYVRRPSQARTYGVEVKAEPSTRFADWIETNLLKLEASRLRSVTFDNTKVDARQGRILPGETLKIERADASAPWTMAGLAPTEEIDPAKSSSLSSTLGDLKIVGVRPKPAGLTAELKAAGGEGIRLDRTALSSLARRGFYFADGRLLSNEGGLFASTDEGIVYALQFGDVTFAEGEALSAGSEDESAAGAEPDEKAKSKDPKAPPKKGDGAIESRFLFVRAQFEPDLIARPEEPPADGELPAEPFQTTPAERQAAQRKIETARAEYQRKLDQGKTRAAELSGRFAAWYYVVPGDSYRNLVLNRASLVHPKPDPAAPPTGGGFPMPGPGGPFGGGHPFGDLPAPSGRPR